MMLTRCHPNRSSLSRRQAADTRDRFMSEFWGRRPFQDAAPLTQDDAAVDVAETDDDYRIAVELPGVAKDDFKISVENSVLYLTADKKRGEELENARHFRRERTFGQIERRFSFSSDIDGTKVTAAYKDGVLNVIVPKAEAAKPRQLEID